LKAGLKRNDPGYGIRILLVLIISASPLFGLNTPIASYSTGEDGSLVLYFHPDPIPEALIRSNINNGHQSEIFASFRIQMSGSPYSIGGEHLEIHIRKTGFRDKITGDYILLLNGRESAVYRDWDLFFKAFSGILIYPSGIHIPKDSDPILKVREKIIYKKLVPPFSILYLLPGKFIRQGSWEPVFQGDFY
jgi:hypothetical protein